MYARSEIVSLYYDRWINTAVMLGVLCTTAVLVGALLVGDSMRGSLRDLTLQRLGQVDAVLFAPTYIEPVQNEFAESVIYFNAAVQYRGRVSGTQILALPPSCALRYSFSHTFTDEVKESVVLNQALADKLEMHKPDEISLRLLSPQSIPPESTFGRKDNLIRTQITVEKIIPNKGLGRFSLKADQQAEPLLIVPLDWLQKKLDVGNKVNAVFITSNADTFQKNFNPKLVDLGINVKKQYITSSRLLFTEQQASAIKQKLPNAASGLLYLATSIRATRNNSETPYSTIFATGDELKDNEIALNQWAADDLNVSVGAEIELTWFEPDNVNVAKTQKFTLAKIIPNNEYPNDVVPEVNGFTDEASIADWDPPFPFDAKKIRKKDEYYWDKYRAAPKVFVSLKVGQKLFGSRFGNVSTLITDTPLTSGGIDISIFGLNFVPVKQLGLAASQGTTPFSVLFISFSFFIIASALMLVMMLFRLSVEMKAKQIGIRLAVGWRLRRVLGLLLTQGSVVAFAGSVLGVLFGILYAKIMIYGLTTWWVDAVTVPFLTLHISAASLLIGFFGGFALALLTIAFSLRRLGRISVHHLLYNNLQSGSNVSKRFSGGANIIRSPFRFAVSNAARNKTRSQLCVGLVASTVFLVLTISVFRIEPTEQYTDGIDLIAETAFPVFENITTAQGRSALGIQQEQERQFADVKIYPFRMKDGDSTSCLNLYQTGNPRILGVPQEFIERENWKALSASVSIDADGTKRVPIILDNNTAMYSLHIYGGVGSVYELNIGDEIIRCEIVALLNNSFLQGEILVSETNLLTLFPDVAGWRYFLMQCKDTDRKTLYDMLGDYGLQTETTADRLRQLFAIQNTYLSTFQGLGGIGLLLGTFGLAVVQVRNVLERRKELALFLAIGFTKSRCVLMLLYENLTLLFYGLALALCGTFITLLIIYAAGQLPTISVGAFAVQFVQLIGGMIFIGIVSNVAASLAVLKIPVARELAEER